MATLHKMSKRPWGTITKPDNMSLGHQKMTAYEVEQTVNRLYYVPKAREAKHKAREAKHARPNNPKMSSNDVRKLIERLTRKSAEKATDSKRVPEGKLREIGILNSFAWKGYN